MKVAIASDGKIVSQHFGHCEGFQIYDVNERNVIAKSFVPNPGHKPGFLPNFLNDLGVNVIIAGGMGGGAVEIFNEHNIETVVGVTGETDLAINKYIKNELQSTGSICHQHMHADECGE